MPRLLAAVAAVFLVACTSSSTTANKTPIPPSPSLLPPASPSPTAAATPASITGIPMPGGEVGIAYTATLSASGGGTPYTWSLDSGNLPPGVTLGADGSFSGVPGANGTFNFTVKASDSQNQYTTQGATIKIAAHLTASLLPACAQACRVEQGCVSVCGGFGQQSGGVGPFGYSASGNIPGGMTLNGLSLAGSFPSLAQFWQFNVTITDALGATASVSPIFYVYPHIKFSGGKMSCNYPVTPCAAQFAYSGGTPGGGVSASVKIASYSQTCITQQNCPAPPDIVSAKAGSGTVTITVSLGSPNPAWQSDGWNGTLTVVLTDSSRCGPGNCNTGSVPISITVGAG